MSGADADSAGAAEPPLYESFGLGREDLSLLNRLAFAGAASGRIAEARTICAAMRRLLPDHACWAIGEYLCLMAEGRRETALDWLEREGLPRGRAWEQAAELLLAETAGGRDAARRDRLVARLAADETGRAVLREMGVDPTRDEAAGATARRGEEARA